MKNHIAFLLIFSTLPLIAQSFPKINWVSVNRTNGIYLSDLNVDKDENIFINIINLLGLTPKYIEKISKDNLLVFRKEYFNENDVKTNIIFDQDGNYYELGSYLRKYDFGGKLNWEIRLFYKGLTTPDFLYVLPTREIILGSIWQNRYLLSKYSEDGKLIWDKYLTEMRDFVSQIISDKNNNLYMHGYAWIDSSKTAVYPSIIKVNSNGNTLWRRNNEINLGTQKFYLDNNESLVTQGVERLNNDGQVIWSTIDKINPRDLCIDSDNNIYAIGNDIDSQFLIKVDNTGKTLWKKIYTTKSPVPKCWLDDYGYCNALINDFLIKFNKNGNEVWRFNLNNILGRNDIRYAKQVKQNIILGGSIWNGGIFVASITDPNPTNIPSEKTVPDYFSLSQNYPNPFNPETTMSYSIPKSEHVTIKIFDVLGREVVTLVNEYKQAGTYKANFNASGLVSGVYFYQLSAGSFLDVKKMIVVK